MASEWSTVLLTEAAATHGAVCLDGSPGGYHIRRRDPKKWIVFHEGGGWCLSDAECAERAQTPLGSSRNWPASPEDSYTDAADLIGSHAFRNHTMVFARYCDGSSWTGNVEGPVMAASGSQEVFYRGRRLFDALVTDLLSMRGLDAADVLIYGGCSAGALTAYLHADRVAKAVPTSVQVLVLADGMLPLPVSSWDGEPLIERSFSWGLRAWNATGSLPPNCVEAYPGKEAWRCLVGTVAAAFVQAPLLSLGSKFDLWQQGAVIGANASIGQVPAPVQEYWLQYAAAMEAALVALPPSSSFFLTGCIAHCQTGSARLDPWSRGAYAGTSINGTLLESAVVTWYTSQLRGTERRQHCPSSPEAELAAGAPAASASQAYRWLDQCGAQPCAGNVCGNTLWALSVSPANTWPGVLLALVTGLVVGGVASAIAWNLRLGTRLRWWWQARGRRVAGLMTARGSRADNGDQLSMVHTPVEVGAHTTYASEPARA